jgi:hypothetical protein
MNIFKMFLGSDGGAAEEVEAKSHEAHDIKNQMTGDILRIKSKVDKLNKNTNTKLNQISADLESVTYKIAVATGGKK